MLLEKQKSRGQGLPDNAGENEQAVVVYQGGAPVGGTPKGATGAIGPIV